MSPMLAPGRVLRVVREEAGNEYAVVEGWWPVLKPHKYGDRLNLFATWRPGAVPAPHDDAKPDKRRKTGAKSRDIIVRIGDILVWPLTLEQSSRVDDGGRIPLSALHFLRERHGIDLSQKAYSLGKRGEKFYIEVAKKIAMQVARNVRDSWAGPTDD